jgi:heparin binding hemagglutinin HbhA
MPVDLPTTENVRKIRHDVAKTAAERAEAARTPLLAVLGAGDLAVTAVSKAVAEARARAAEARVADLPQRLNGEELRKTLDELRAQAGQAYVGFAEQGERTWGRIRKQPQVKEAIARIETYTEKLDARVDDLVDDATDAAEKALAVVTAQTRSTGERVARATQRFTGRTAQTVTDVSSDAADAVTEAGAEVAHETRSATRKAANRTAPKTTAPKATTPKSAASKPAARRTGSANGSGPAN